MISLIPMTRQMCHEFYKNFQNDPAIFMDMSKFAEYVYIPGKVDRYFDENTIPSRRLFAIVVDGKIVGECKLKYIDFEKRECSAGIHLLDDSVKGKGYGTEAERLLLRYAFEELDMAAVNADAVLKNTRSQHVMEKVGFRYVREDETFKYYRCRRDHFECVDSRVYYEAYDERYKQVHSEDIRWFSAEPSPIVSEVIGEFSLSQTAKMLEIGCGEGRDAGYLLCKGYDVLATDVSAEAVQYCRTQYPGYEKQFQVLDCVTGKLNERFDFIYAVAVVHMLVLDEDRNRFYGFIREHLKSDGIALIGTMGDGNVERQSDITTAFDLQERTHEESGKTMKIAGTSCRMVNFATFERELARNKLKILKQGVTAVEPDFPCMMYAVVTR